jgi:cyclopropane-fatty-acyl-phospholipid synthase
MGIGDVPLPTEATIAGQNMAIAIPVNRFAPPSDMPPTSATFAVTSAAFCPGSDSIGQIDWPMATALTGSPGATPALVSAARNASPLGSAWAGAESTMAAVNTPADSARGIACLRCTGESYAVTMPKPPKGQDGLKPHFEDVQAHYDLSDEFFRLFLDPTQTYSCAYFERDDMTLEEAQLAKIDLALGKLGLKPGMTLLDVGCGWGATMLRAIEKYDVNVIGLTLSKNQANHVERLFAESDSARSKRVVLGGWEQFNDPVDRIVSIGAFEHFGHDRYDDFFKMAHNVLPDDGIMLLHTITGLHPNEMAERGMPLSFQFARFIKFMVTEIFPGGRLPSIPMVADRATAGGFTVTRVQSLQPHYAKTLDIWAAALEHHKDEAIAIQSEEVYERYMKYLTGCADMFRVGYIDVNQFTLEK